ncbi:cobaltochelatase subunit CobN [Diaphorobacter aerolatus]|uniref:cobaltochelatase subunit CobN n=1 Tax=Diaphorobacter aerolatus TaxID=1288495 RepID=UPI0021F6B06E|nr:cobaltochelatase subunit CobN [Diaphorobacter aerolatus]
MQPLLRDGLADRMPVAQYREWLATLPKATQDALHGAWGDPERSAMVVREGGTPYFVIPRLLLGNVAVLPQPPRSERWDAREKTLYHSNTAMPSHHYLAVYLWARQQWRADALVHYGTHGTQEWLPGKERGLSVYDPPMLALGDLPVAYPYIADNIGEAIQAKRRGRAVTITHQTPAFAPGGLHDALTRIHDLLHQWLTQDEGAVKERIFIDLVDAARRERLLADMGWSETRARESMREFVDALHAQLHELAETAQPQGLHTLGRAPEELHRLGTVLLMLGREFWQAAARHAGVAEDDLDEALVGPWARLPDTAPYRLLKRHVVLGESAEGLPAALRSAITRARKAYDDLGAQGETPALIAFLDGRHLPTSYGGDPIRNPDAYPTGRNLYGFDPSRVPTRQAWEAGKQSAEQLLAEHLRLHGRQPSKLTFSLWSVETMRHQGQLEAQALWLMGVEPVWDKGGRVTDVRLLPREALGRPRVDVVLSVTGLYRDHFPNTLKQLARAVWLASRAAEDDNPIATNARAIAERLRARGAPGPAAERAGATRIFSSESGRYGTGLDDAALDTGSWKGKADGDRKLAAVYLSRMQFAYGPDEQHWGESGIAGAKDVNLYAEHLRGTQGAVLSRSSNLYGMLTTDDPFQYLGGISLAVRHLDGKAPALYISNLRGQGAGRVEGASQFLAKELATRQFHPGYISGLMREGYAGTLQVLDATNNFWGWTATAREIVRDDQWQEMAEVYVRDKHQLGLRAWFERHNPHALAQTMERMLEAARQGYWQTDAATINELTQRWRDLARRHDIRSDNAAFAAMVGARAQPGAGFGMSAPVHAAPRATVAPVQTAMATAMAPEPEAREEPQPPKQPPLSGLLLQPVEAWQPPSDTRNAPWLLLLITALALVGAWRQHQRFASLIQHQPNKETAT